MQPTPPTVKTVKMRKQQAMKEEDILTTPRKEIAAMLTFGSGKKRQREDPRKETGKKAKLLLEETKASDRDCYGVKDEMRM